MTNKNPLTTKTTVCKLESVTNSQVLEMLLLLKNSKEPKHMCMCIVFITFGETDSTCPKPRKQALQTNEVDIYLHANGISEPSKLDGNNQSINTGNFDEIHIHFDGKRKPYETLIDRSKKEPKCKANKKFKNIQACKCKCGR